MILRGRSVLGCARRWGYIGARQCAVYGIDVRKFLEALTIEEQANFANTQGSKEKFSSFASRSVKEMTCVPMELFRDHAVISTAFEHYDSLDFETRKEIVQQARKLIDQPTESRTKSLITHGDVNASTVMATENQSTGSELSITNQAKGGVSVLDTRRDNRVNGAVREKPTSVEFREAFSKIADVWSSSSDDSDDEPLEDIVQGSSRWMHLRRQRLTASIFANVLGMFGNPFRSRTDVWLEKLGLKEPFQGNVMTRWGTKSEKGAREVYQSITGHEVKQKGIAFMGDHAAEQWMSASPDGIIKISRQGPTAPIPKAARKLIWPETRKGILEIKCPYGRFNPEFAVPYDHMKDYYIPQVQCLMDVLDCEWCHVFVWTQCNGSKIFFVKRDREYYKELYDFLSVFWWKHVIPAKNCLENSATKHQYLDYAPMDMDSRHLVSESKRLAKLAPQVIFDPDGQLKSPM